MATVFNVFLIILFSVLQIIKSQSASNCLSITIDVLDFGSSSFDPDNWDGVYPITNKTSFTAPIWRIPGKDSNKWLKFIETHWVLSGQDTELLIYNSSSSMPPTNGTSLWTHEYKADPATLRLDCSSSLSPTSFPTPAPTTSPTYSPTVFDCDILTISDKIANFDGTVIEIDSYFEGWSYERLEDDYTGRPIWKYQQSNIQSLVQFLNTDGWVVYLNDGSTVNTYSTDLELFGYFPPLNTPILFNITTNNQPARIFNFTCLPTDFPTSAPTDSPTLTPTDSPIANPTRTPTASPNGAPTPPPTNAPTEMPTVAPTISCETLKIDVPIDLIEADNPNCDINFTAIFDSYWVQQISRSNRPSWTLDCQDSNPIYTRACDNGYSGLVFFISNQWEIQVHSKTDDCFERFIVDNTGSYFIPTNAEWIDESTEKQYTFTITCADKVSLPTISPTAQALVDSNTVTVVERAWFWVALVLILLICCVLLIGGYCYNKQKQPVVVYQQNMPSVSMFSKSDIQLAANPPAAYEDPNAAPSAGNVFGDNEGDDLKIDEVENDGQSTLRKMGSTAYDPEMNPNLKQASVASAISVAAVKRGTNGGRSGSNGEMNRRRTNDEKTDTGNDLGLNGDDDDNDGALDIIAGPKKDAKEYNQLVPDDDDDDDDVERMFDNPNSNETPEDDIFNV